MRRGALVGKPESKRSLGRSKLRWKDNTKMYLQETLCEGVKWIYLVQDREKWREFVNMAMGLWFL
jgi:hypothetical protein